MNYTLPQKASPENVSKFFMLSKPENKVGMIIYNKKKLTDNNERYKINPNDIIKLSNASSFFSVKGNELLNNLCFDEFDTAIATEEILKKDWLSPVEDETWQDL